MLGESKPPNAPARYPGEMEVLERYRSLVDDWAAFRSACQRPLPAMVRVNTIKTDIDRAKLALRAADIEFEPVEWHDGLFALPDDQPGANWPYVHGWIHGQEEVSALPATVLDPDPGDRIWDTCAAPGSKTTQVAALMEDTGRIIGTDSNLGRISALRSNAERLGVTNLAITNEDARSHSLGPFASPSYDGALVDVPCSCEGTVRKNPDTLTDWSIDHVTGIAGVQRGILRRAIQTTRPGGRVVYSTCTFAPEENEAVVDHVLDTEDCRIVQLDIPLTHTRGIIEWQDNAYDPTLERAARIYPHHNDTGGFFVAALEVGT